MTWVKSAADRQRDQAAYGPAYRRNRDVARRRAGMREVGPGKWVGGRCEQCGHKHNRLEADHIINRASSGTDDPANLRMLCKGPPCSCHDRKTASEGGGYRKPSDPQPLQRTRW